jgi:hypothetical protein
VRSLLLQQALNAPDQQRINERSASADRNFAEFQMKDALARAQFDQPTALQLAPSIIRGRVVPSAAARQQGQPSTDQQLAAFYAAQASQKGPEEKQTPQQALLAGVQGLTGLDAAQRASEAAKLTGESAKLDQRLKQLQVGQEETTQGLIDKLAKTTNPDERRSLVASILAAKGKEASQPKFALTDTLAGTDELTGRPYFAKTLVNTETGLPVAGAGPAQQQGAPTAGQVVSGYRFKGGDPSNQKNWEKV